MILDTNAVISKVKRKERILESITSITPVAYLSILEYQWFSGDTPVQTLVFKLYYL